MAENQCLYTNVLLGFGAGSQTIANFGCNMTSIQNGLKRKGYSLKFPSPVQYNTYCKNKNSFVNKTMIDPIRIKDTQGEYFLVGRRENWNDANVIKYLADDNYIVLGEVSAKGIGGSGQHFVELRRVTTSGGKVTMTYVDDPWGGKSEMKVTDRYNRYGNILSLRVYQIIKPKVDEKKTVKITSNVNVRTAPYRTAPIAKNTGTEIDGLLKAGNPVYNCTLVKGEEVGNLNGWWMSPKGRFFWSGCTDLKRSL